MRFRSKSALVASAYGQFNKIIEATYRHMSSRHATRMNDVVFGMDSSQNAAPWKLSCRIGNIFTSVCNERALRIEKDGSNLIRSSWSVSFEHIRADPSLENKRSSKSGNVRRLLKTSSSHSVEVLLV